MAVPIFQPIGPTSVCAIITAGTSEQNGTTIIEITAGVMRRKKRSKYTKTKPARMAEITCP